MTDSKDAAVAIPEGMVAWSGGDSAPADWDGGPVLYRDGRPRNLPELWWHDPLGADADIIAYRPKPTAPIEDGVTQADWGAAEPFRRGWGGKYDRDFCDLAEAFARHASKARAEATEAAAKVVMRWRESDYSEETNTMCDAILDDIREGGKS